MKSSYKNCRCHTCAKDFNSLGIARHRAMHRDKGEDCKITLSNGQTFSYDFAFAQPSEAKPC